MGALASANPLPKVLGSSFGLECILIGCWTDLRLLEGIIIHTRYYHSTYWITCQHAVALWQVLHTILGVPPRVEVNESWQKLRWKTGVLSPQAIQKHRLPDQSLYIYRTTDIRESRLQS